MAQKKAASKNIQHISPKGKHLGVKTFDGKKVSPGMILVRQRGSRVVLGKGVAAGRDHTIYAVAKGSIKFGKRKGRNIVSVV